MPRSEIPVDVLREILGHVDKAGLVTMCRVNKICCSHSQDFLYRDTGWEPQSSSDAYLFDPPCQKSSLVRFVSLWPISIQGFTKHDIPSHSEIVASIVQPPRSMYFQARLVRIQVFGSIWIFGKISQQSTKSEILDIAQYYSASIIKDIGGDLPTQFNSD